MIAAMGRRPAASILALRDVTTETRAQKNGEASGRKERAPRIPPEISDAEAQELQAPASYNNYLTH
jgi:hypothetical protein